MSNCSVGEEGREGVVVDYVQITIKVVSDLCIATQRICGTKFYFIMTTYKTDTHANTYGYT